MFRRRLACLLAVTASLLILAETSHAAPTPQGVDRATVTQSAADPEPDADDDPSPLVLAGLGAVAVGTALVLTARRRRAQRLTL